MNDKTPVRIRKSGYRSPTRVTQAVKTKGTLLYPESAEREYASLALKHVRMYGEVLKENLPEILNIFRETREDAKGCRESSRKAIEKAFSKLFDQIAEAGG